MIPDMPINWKDFEYKYADNPQRAFENLTYYLFCYEFGRKNGIFRYIHQPHIETEPIQVGDKLIGFQAKYYGDSIRMSEKEEDMIKAVKGAAELYPGIAILRFYISKEFAKNSKGQKPSYQDRVEKAAAERGIEIQWFGISNIEMQLMKNDQMSVCRNIFFQIDSEIQASCHNLETHKNDILKRIHTSIYYKGEEIRLPDKAADAEKFLETKDQVLIIDGPAGSGKSALVKRWAEKLNNDGTAFLAFYSEDLDVKSQLSFLGQYGPLTLEDLLSVYEEADKKILYIDSAEKYFNLENQDVFEDILQIFKESGWKIIFTIRGDYKEAFIADLLPKEKVNIIHIDPICSDVLEKVSEEYKFKLPTNKRMVELLCIPFYLRMYLALEDLEDADRLALNKEAFEEKIWSDIIRNNKSKKHHMPAYREEAFINMIKFVLQNECYAYPIQTSDNSAAFEALEQDGVIIQTNDAESYYFSHDVFEELAVNHIFTKRYQSEVEPGNFFEGFRPSWRCRKLFRNWFVNFMSEEEHWDIIHVFLLSESIDSTWQDEILLTIVSSDNLERDYSIIAEAMCSSNYKLLRKLVVLINMCCRVAGEEYKGLGQGNLWAFRFSKPSGHAWKMLFQDIFQYKTCINWDKELVTTVVDLLESWTGRLENIQTDNTELAGKIGIFLYEKLISDRELRYEISDECMGKLRQVLLNSAWRIQEDLERIFCPIMKSGRTGKARIYLKLAEEAIGDYFHYRQMPFAMPEMTMRLMKALWLLPTEGCDSPRMGIEYAFGITPYLSVDDTSVSGLKTPIIVLLNQRRELATDFLIDFMNQTGAAYAKSSFSKECFLVNVYIGGEQKEQTASDSLWKMYRGRCIGPKVISSLLMGYEKWLLASAQRSSDEELIDYCRNVLLRSENVMLTAVIVSVVKAYPERLLDLICDLLKTKEILKLDRWQVGTEHIPPLALPSEDDWLRNEQKENDRLSHRKVTLWNIIFGYQADNEGKTEDEFKRQRDKIWQAIDEVKRNNTQWPLEDRVLYESLDLRNYKKVEQEKTDDNKVHTLYQPNPELAAYLRKVSQKENNIRTTERRNVDIWFWSKYQFENKPDCCDDEKYANTVSLQEELKEVWDDLCSIKEYDPTENLLLINRYTSIASYTTAVILRDYSTHLTNDDRILCQKIVIKLGHRILSPSDLDKIYSISGIEAVIVSLMLLLNVDDMGQQSDQDILYLLVCLFLIVWKNDKVIKVMAETIWNYRKDDGIRLVTLFSEAIDKYSKEEADHSCGLIKKKWSEYRTCMEMALKKNPADIADIDFTKMDKTAVFVTIALVLPNIKEGAQIAEATKNIAIETCFGRKNGGKTAENDYPVECDVNYINWFADVLLFCSSEERWSLVQTLMEKADMLGNQNIEFLFAALIEEQDKHGKTEEFWDVWKILKSKMIELSTAYGQLFCYNYNMPIGKDNLIATYLFANTRRKPGVYSRSLFSEKEHRFFDDFIDRAGSTDVVLYSISKLLTTAGKEPYRDRGIEWIYRLIQKDSGYDLRLYDKTLLYLEEYMEDFVRRRKSEFRDNIKLARKVQIILEYMVKRGSKVAFMVREQI